MPRNGGFKNYNIEEMESKENKERYVDAVKEVNNVEDRVIFGKPKIGKFVQRIIISVISLFAVIIITLVVFDIYPNSAIDKHYTLSFVTNGAEEIESYEYDESKVITLNSITREGYLFVGWYLDADFSIKATNSFLSSLEDHGNITFYAKWVPEDLEVVITFNSVGGIKISQQTLLVNSSLDTFVPIKGNLFFAGWFLEPTYQNRVTDVPFENSTLYALWSPIELITVGKPNQLYQMPVNPNDYQTTWVNGGFQIAKTETTYQVWYEVRIWAEANGYHFVSLGKQGSHGLEGALPTSMNLEPVTSISYLDTIVWLNAFSEMQGLDPVYRNNQGAIIRDSDMTIDQTFAIDYNDYNGYRLPSFEEWELAARWTNLTSESNYTVFVGERYWTKGTIISGGYNNLLESLNLNAWYEHNSEDRTHDVATRNHNVLGIYDMNGNVSEWCNYPFLTANYKKPIRGGSYLTYGGSLNLSINDFIDYNTISDDVGFRIAIGRVIY